jgi:hypothetical protein
MDPNGITLKIQEILTPLVGSMMAESTVRISLTSAKATTTPITPVILEAIGKDLEHRLAIFLGSDKAAEIGKQVANISV